jgi:hypothetical protein
VWGVSAAVAVLLAAAQLVPYRPDRGPPPVSVEPEWDSPRTRELAVRACFDCHSSQTRWPWYASVAPASWIVRNDVDHGRADLDFTRWADRPGEEATEAGETVRSGAMPPGYYLLLHPDARLDDEERSVLAEGLDATIGTAAPGDEQARADQSQRRAE